MIKFFLFGCFILVFILITENAVVASLGGVAISLFFLTSRYSKLKNKCLDSGFTFAVYSLLSNFSNFRAIFADDDRINGEGYYLYAIRDYIDQAFIIQVVGTYFILMGFLLAEKRNFSFPKIEYQSESKNKKQWLIFTGFFCTFLQLFSLPSFLGSFGTLIESVPLAIIMLLAASNFEKRENHLKNLLYALLFVATLQKVLTAYLRMEMILPTVAFATGFFYKGRNSMKQLVSARLIPVYIFIFLFMTVFSYLGKTRSTAGSGISRLEQIIDVIFSPPEEAADEKGQSILTRLSNVNQLTNVVDLTEKKGLYMGKTIEALGIAFIPRFLWPDKPIIAPGVWFALEINRAVLKENDHYSTSINITVFGEFFLNYGWPGLVAGCFLFGIFWGMLWQSSNFSQKDKNVFGSFFGFYLLYIGFFGLGAGLHTHITVLSLYLIFFFLSRLSKFLQLRNENTLYRARMARK